jgi:superfamily I DNA/RNA helicase
VTALAAREEVAALLAKAAATEIGGTETNGAAVGSLLDERRLSVISALDAKGLEYDAAVVVDPERIIAESPAGTRTLYVALTRATQRLYVCEQ